MLMHSGNPESLEAFAARDRRCLRAATLEHISRRGAQGATADEICAAFDLGHNSVAPRITELKAESLIVELFEQSGRRVRRKTRQGHAAGVVIAREFANMDPSKSSLFGDLAPESRYPD